MRPVDAWCDDAAHNSKQLHVLQTAPIVQLLYV
jgi:hypothetical protein